ncbi:hypothetical protein Patl1_03892 [Pistacia atlantica]|uniref:Uncharacterized protein n=2 Tax=Pistacia atlantica TaxID=434234 RepID=A0ACC1BX13_9ROSI|nr:hypothetical protein Patl1_03888 [Pistacia atlantica]KAJ0103529.1 hypothetical protein Patl1_03892 [Pistacia atlantica]
MILVKNQLENNKFYHFKFHYLSVRRIIFSCDFLWDGIVHGYSMYDSHRDTCKQCDWIIRHSEVYKGIVPCKQTDIAAEPHCFNWEI